MQTALWIARGLCLIFGGGVGMLLSERVCRRLCRVFAPGEAVLMRLMLGVGKTVAASAAAVTAAPLPPAISILYTGVGILAAHCLEGTPKQETVLSVICPWLIMYLPFTGALACLGGAFLALAADALAVTGLAMIVLAAPMALLQFGAEGSVVLLAGAVLVCPGQIIAACHAASGKKLEK